MPMTLISVRAAVTAVISLAYSLAAAAGDLRITDSRGVEVVVSAATIDYGGMVVGDKELDGIRLQQGDATVLVRWSAVDSVKIVKVDETTRPATVSVEVVLRDGKRRPATLLEKGRMVLSGKSDLGEYSIELKKIRAIVPVR